MAGVYVNLEESLDVHIEEVITYEERVKIADMQIAECRKALKLNKNNASYHNNLGCNLLKKSRLIRYKRPEENRRLLDEAIAEYKKVIAIDNHNAVAHFNLGLSYSNKTMLDEAISEYKEALKINPDYPFAHYNLGRAYQVKGRKDPEFRSLAPSHYYKAGLLFLKQGSKDSALMAFSL